VSGPAAYTSQALKEAGSVALEQEFAYYRAHQSELVAEHEGQFVVIKGETVLGFYPTYEAAYVETVREHEAGTFLIQQVRPGEDGYTQSFHSRVA
jgi:hypothetical protein